MNITELVQIAGLALGCFGVIKGMETMEGFLLTLQALVNRSTERVVVEPMWSVC